MVDIDAAVTNLASTHSALVDLNERSFADPRLTLIHDDAFRWLLRRPAPEAPFDVVFADLPDPTDDASSRLYSREFYLLVKRALAADGMAVIQAGPLPSRFHGAVKETLKGAGYRVLSLHPVGPDPMLGIPGVFEASFLAASPSTETIGSLYRALRSGTLTLNGDAAGIIDPYLESAVQDGASANSLFQPLPFFSTGSSLTERFIEVQTTLGSLLAHINAPTGLVRTQIANLITGRGPFASYR